MNYDIFNGDADGIIALIQLRLANPKQSTLITGVKRDIELVRKTNPVEGDSLTVLDISMEKNVEALESALNAGAQVLYFDHHRSGKIPHHTGLEAHIDLDPNTCTSLLVDQVLEGQFHLWAITAAYGDNLIKRADELCTKAGLSKSQSELLREFGTLINYNGYGTAVTDLHYHPADLYQSLLNYSSPFKAIEDADSPFHKLREAYELDMQKALSVESYHSENTLTVFELPYKPWSKRVSGVFGNLLANKNPDSAHAVLTMNIDGSYTVSLRAPLNNKKGAGDICSQFATGGGRAAAAGINALPKTKIGDFIQSVRNYYA
ncbi:MAG: DHH family phosphoesterase [Kangiellaceae bacterium]|nr:DHH family phosphoesterase [Kangiellaceae bacterium]